MNNFGSGAQCSRCYQLLKVMVDMNESMSWVQGSRCYKQLKVVDNMNNLRSCQLKPLYAMNILQLRVIGTILGLGEKTSNVMSNSRSWMTWMTQGHEHRALDAMNNSWLWMTWTSQGSEVRALDVKNSSRLWITWMIPIHEFIALVLWTV